MGLIYYAKAYTYYIFFSKEKFILFLYYGLLVFNFYFDIKFIRDTHMYIKKVYKKSYKMLRCRFSFLPLCLIFVGRHRLLIL